MVVVLTPKQWQIIREDLHTMYPKTVFMLRNKMKDVLGFTVREHTEHATINSSGEWEQPMQLYTIRLDFYNKNKYTMFLLKFGHLMGNQ